MKKLTQEQFLRKVSEKHKGKYNYSVTTYAGQLLPVAIICPEHGRFEQLAKYHLRGNGCPTCKADKAKESGTLSNEEFLRRAKEVHGERFDYTNTLYLGFKISVNVKCRIHGIFKQNPMNHLAGRGCPACKAEKTSENRRLTQAEFERRCKHYHKDYYDYSKAVYSGVYNTVVIICPKHGEFTQSPNKHMRGFGCELCRQSKGEIKIASLLDSLGVDYSRQKRFADCRHKRPLAFDFCVYKEGLIYLIEFDGQQHNKEVPWWGGLKSYQQLILRDAIKTEYARSKNYPFLRIPHDCSDVESLLKTFLK